MLRQELKIKVTNKITSKNCQENRIDKHLENYYLAIVSHPLHAMRRYNIILAGVSELNAAGLRTALSSLSFDLVFYEYPNQSMFLPPSEPRAEIIILDVRNGSGVGLIRAMEILRRLRKHKTILITETLSGSVMANLSRIGAKAFITPETSIDEIPGMFRAVILGDRYLAEPGSGLPAMPKITRTDCAMMEQLGYGKTTKEISQILGIAEKTIETTRCRLLRKTGTRNTSHLLTFAFRNHLLAPGSIEKS